MNLQTRIDNDLRQAINNRNKDRAEFLKVIVAELSRKPTKEVSDEEVLKELKRMKEGAIICGNTSEVTILEEYLPPMMTEQGIEDFVHLIIHTAHITNLGQIMKHIKESPLAEAIDNKIASKYAKELLKQLEG